MRSAGGWMGDWLRLLVWSGWASVAEVVDLLRAKRATGIGLLNGLPLLDEGRLRGWRLAPIDERTRLIHGAWLRLGLCCLYGRLGPLLVDGR